MPPNNRDAGYLWDMLQAAGRLQEFTVALSYEDYLNSILLQSAVERQLEVLGEAARRMSEAFRQEHPEIPWSSIIGQRNVIAHKEAIKTNSWGEDHYKKSRIDEKIGLLKDYLPDFLVKHKIIYSILSKGIHELSEDECLKYFGSLKLGIELILDEKLEKLDREAKIKEAEKLLSEIHSELK